jgi:hypothetical protein
MNTAVLPDVVVPTVPVRPNSTPALTPAQLVSTLPEEFRAAVLCELLRDLAVKHNNAGVIPVRTPDDEWLANVVLPGTPGAKADQIFFELDDAHRTALMKGFIDLDLDNVLSDEEVESLFKGGGWSVSPMTTTVTARPILAGFRTK